MRLALGSSGIADDLESTHDVAIVLWEELICIERIDIMKHLPEILISLFGADIFELFSIFPVRRILRILHIVEDSIDVEPSSSTKYGQKS